MKKRIFLQTLVVLLFCTFCLTPALAAAKHKVVDKAGLLEHADTLEQRAEEMSKAYQSDIILLTIDSNHGKTSMDYADDYFDQHGCGYGEDNTGILLLIDMDARTCWISTCGKAIDLFTDARIDSMLDKIVPKLSDGDYDGACTEFLNQVRSYYRQLYPPSFSERALESAKRLPVYLLVGAGVGLVVTLILVACNRTKKRASGATYAVENGFALSQQQDRFVNVVHTSHVINTGSGGSGRSGGSGSSVHTSSGGASHGGGGRGF